MSALLLFLALVTVGMSTTLGAYRLVLLRRWPWTRGRHRRPSSALAVLAGKRVEA